MEQRRTRRRRNKAVDGQAKAVVQSPQPMNLDTHTRLVDIESRLQALTQVREKMSNNITKLKEEISNAKKKIDESVRVARVHIRQSTMELSAF
jgi:archaellum component FlaC